MFTIFSCITVSGHHCITASAYLKCCNRLDLEAHVPVDDVVVHLLGDEHVGLHGVVHDVDLLLMIHVERIETLLL